MCVEFFIELFRDATITLGHLFSSADAFKPQSYFSDMIAIPDFAARGMENWGLITYRESVLLYNPKAYTIYQKCQVAAIVAHELAHQVCHLPLKKLTLSIRLVPIKYYLGSAIILISFSFYFSSISYI